MVIFSFIIYDIWKKNCEIHINLEIQLFEIIMHQVVILMVDTQRKDMVGCYGNPDMHTPNLDHLAESGIRFERAYCCQPVCGPARAGLFTGTFPHSNGSWGNFYATGHHYQESSGNVYTIGESIPLILENGMWMAGIILAWGDVPRLEPAYWYDMRNYMEELEENERFRSRITAMINDPVSLRISFLVIVVRFEPWTLLNKIKIRIFYWWSLSMNPMDPLFVQPLILPCLKIMNSP